MPRLETVGWVVALVAFAACQNTESSPPDAGPGDVGPADSWTAECGPNLAAHKSACIPKLDDCSGNQVPVPGGGCKKVGAEDCDSGWGIKGPPDWTCQPIGPPRTCLAGWAQVKDGWCEPILPQSSCPEGQMEVIGQSACQPVGACGSGTWGSIQTASVTLFVDQAYQAADADGSQAKPFPSIGQALAVAQPGAQIAVAAGTYGEDLIINKQVKIEGRCPQLVTLQGQSAKDEQATTLTVAVADGVTLRSLTVTGPRRGIAVLAAKGTTVEDVVVQGSSPAVELAAQAEATLRRVLVSQAQGGGVRAWGSQLTLDRCTVRDTQPWAGAQAGGEGVLVGIDSLTGLGSTLAIEDSVLLDNWGTGIFVLDSSGTVERSVIQGSHRENPAPIWTAGVKAGRQVLPTTLVLRDSVVASNRGQGLDLISADVTVERSVIRDTLPRLHDPQKGNGLGIASQNKTGPSSLTVRRSVVTGSITYNIWLAGTKALIQGSVITHGQPNAENHLAGCGIFAVANAGIPSSVTVEDCVLAANHLAGLETVDSAASVERTVVKDTLASGPVGQEGGVGLYIISTDSRRKTFTLRDSTVTGTHGDGLLALSSIVTVERSVIGEAQATGLASGILAFAWEAGGPTDLTVRESVLAKNRYGGIELFDSTGTVDRTVVRDTAAATDLSGQASGVGIYVGRSANASQPGQGASLVLSDSVVDGSHGEGILVVSGRVVARSSILRNTQPIPEGYGDGLSIAAAQDDGRPELVLEDSLVEASARAGLLFDGGGGSVRRSVFTKGVFAVALQGGADPVIADDNVFEDNQENRISYGQNLALPPPLVLPPPPQY